MTMAEDVSQHMLAARLPRDRVRATYTWIAPLHDGLALLVEARARKKALEWADVQNGEAVLEVAVGTGLSFREVLARNPDGRNVGVDVTPAMLRRARRRARKTATDHYELYLGDAYDLDFDDDTFDLVLNSYMFDMLPAEDFTTVLAEFKRVLKPGGRLVQLNMTKAGTGLQRLWEGIYKLYPPLLGGCRAITTAASFEEAGFVDVRRTFVSQRSFPSEIVYGVKPAQQPSA